MSSAIPNDYLVYLRKLMTASFSVGELQLICSELGVDWEEMSGSTKSGQILSLIGYLQRRGRVEDLARACAAARGQEDWRLSEIFGSQAPTTTANLSPPAVKGKGTAPVLFKQGYALVIGVGSHQFAPGADVPVTVSDAQAVHDILVDPTRCGYPVQQVTFLHDATATAKQIETTLADLAQHTDETSTVLVYYAGHGESDESGEYCLFTHDGKVAAGAKVQTGTGLQQRRLLELFAAIKAKRMLVVFNACHSGNFSHSALDLGLITLGGGNVPDQTKAAILGTGRGRIVITACAANQLSYIGPNRLTYFTQALTDGLKGDGLPQNGGYIGAYDLYQYVYNNVSSIVLQQQNQVQEPELAVTSAAGPFPVALARGALGGLAPSLSAPPNTPRVLQMTPQDAQARLAQAGVTPPTDQ